VVSAGTSATPRSPPALDTRRGPGKRTPSVNQQSALPAAGPSSPGDPCPQWTERLCKSTGQRGVWWAREELNLRPLPCQIQRARAGLNVGGLETGKDYRKAAGEPWNQGPSPPTIYHVSPTVVLVPTAVGCCPSAAPTHRAQLLL
jgi:hypothetical protein